MRPHWIWFGVGMLAVTSGQGAQQQDEFSRWMGQTRQEFSGYMEARDREFASYLDTQWQEFTAYAGLVRDKTPKPKRLPLIGTPPRPLPAEPVAKEPVTKAPVTKEPVTKEPVATEPVTKEPVVREPDLREPVVKVPPREFPIPVEPPAPPVAAPGTHAFDFYGASLAVARIEPPQVELRTPLGDSMLAAFWRAWAGLDTSAQLQQLRRHAQGLALNDWGGLQLHHAFARKVYSGENEQLLLTWFLMAKAGYDIKVGHDGERVALLLPTRQTLYEIPYLTINGQRYYLYRFDGAPTGSRFYSYKQGYPGATQKVDMTLRPTQITAHTATKRRAFQFEGRDYAVDFPLSDDYLAFLRSYPQSDLAVYFTATPQTATGRAILDQLAGPVRTMDPVTAVNFLLRFVQTGFAYQTDDEQFGAENYLFPDETLFYKASDCEDRSFLFAWLVRNLLGLEVVGLTYPGHVATAVALPSSVRIEGASFLKDGRRYFVADPTYINAGVGMVMPQFRTTQPTIVEIRSTI